MERAHHDISMARNLSSSGLVLMITVTSLAILGSFLSWRRQVRLEKECDQLRRQVLAAARRKNNDNHNDNPRSQKCTPSDDGRGENGGVFGDSKQREDREDLSDGGRSTLIGTHQSLMEDGMTVKPIGVIRSIYRLCVGTPRQGLLAPNARGCIDLLQLGDSSPAGSVDGLEGYSHIWILFVFHLNTQSKNASKKIKSKISPPALGGQRVGIFATRTPHRYNPIGITLCKLDRIEKIDKRKAILHISGLDLVDGTPVLDIKPFVPVYDSITTSDGHTGDVRVPSWVAGGLAMQRSVVFTDFAKAELNTILDNNPNALEFYGPRFGEKATDDTLHSVLECIRQVLAVDVRSSYQTKKSRSGKFQAERSGRLKGATIVSSADMTVNNRQNDNICTQQIDNLLIHYQIEEATEWMRMPSEHSGAEDVLSVKSIELLIKR